MHTIVVVALFASVIVIVISTVIDVVAVNINIVAPLVAPWLGHALFAV